MADGSIGPSPAELGTQTDSLNQKNSSSDPLDNGREIIGDTIIGPSRMAPGGAKEPLAARWLRGINDANVNTEVPQSQRLQNLQAIARAALNAGIPRETIDDHLKKLGYMPQKAEAEQLLGRSNETQSQVSPNEIKDITSADLNPLIALFNVLKRRVRMEGNERLNSGANGLPTGKVLNAVWAGVDEETVHAFRQIEAWVNQVKQEIRTNQPNEAMQVTPLPVQPLDERKFRDTEIRIENNRLIADGLEGRFGEKYKAAGEALIRSAEKACLERKEGISELLIDTTGYQEQVLQQVYQSPSGEAISEDIVAFYKRKPNGQLVWLKDNGGRNIAVSGELFRFKLPSNLHNQPNTFSIPRIDDKGISKGVITIKTSPK